MTSDGVAHVPQVGGRGQDLPRLTSLRAFAALAVFLYHMSRHTAWGPGGSLVTQGYVGVGFFFILSGFVLAWSTRPGTSASSFYQRRFARVWPSHFTMMLVALAVPVITYPHPGALAIATNVTLTQAWFPQWPIVFGLNGVSWSLSCEFFFYLITPFVLQAARGWSTRVTVGVLGGWFVLMSGVALGMGLTSGALDIYAYASPLVRSGEFMVGLLFALLATRERLPQVPLWVAVVAVVLAWGATYNRPIPQSVGDVIFTIPFLLLVVAAASADLRGVPALLLRHRFMVYAGQVSFAFYLVHELVLLNGRLLWGDGPAGLLSRIGLSLLVIAAIFGLSVVLHELVEKPAQKFLRAAFGRTS